MELDLHGVDLLVKLIKGKNGVTLPKVFPAGTQFFEFDGIPISADPSINVLAWDVPGGRRFPHTIFSPDFALISEAKFRALAQRLSATSLCNKNSKSN